MEIDMNITGFGCGKKALLALLGADPAVVQTRWGYRLSPGGAFGATSVRAVGLALLGMIAWIWASLGVPVDPVLTAMLLGLSGFLFATGWLLFWHGWDARPGEAQIDLERYELRLGCVHSWGWFALQKRIPLGQIGDFVILPAASKGGQAGLYARLGNGQHAFELMTGSPAQIASIRHRILGDMEIGQGGGALHRRWAMTAQI